MEKQPTMSSEVKIVGDVVTITTTRISTLSKEQYVKGLQSAIDAATKRKADGIANADKQIADLNAKLDEVN